MMIVFFVLKKFFKAWCLYLVKKINVTTDVQKHIAIVINNVKGGKSQQMENSE